MALLLFQRKRLNFVACIESMNYMKFRNIIATLILGATLMPALPAYAAVVDLPIITVKGQKCYYYDVLPKENIYQVTKKLGLTRDKLVEYNPSAADGLKPHMRLFFPKADFEGTEGNRPAVYAHAAGIKTHVVKRGETLYGIARQYGMSPDYLAQLNPQTADGIRIGDTLRITADGEETGLSTAGHTESPDGIIKHEIKKGETLFGIANSYNIALEVLLEANPTLDPLKYKEGQIVNIPTGTLVEDYSEQLADNSAPTLVPATSQTTGDNAKTDMPPTDQKHHDAVATDIIAEEVTEDDPFTPNDNEVQMTVDSLHVAVMLPFMLNEPTMSRATQLYTEFFKGMLMAADEINSKTTSGMPVRFHFFDTAASVDTVSHIMNQPIIQEMDLIIAPEASEQLAEIVTKVPEDVPVLNIFAVKDESYRDHRNIIQTNIPHDAMYNKAIDMFLEKYAGYTPVFISRSEGMADKEAFTSELKKRLTQENRDFSDISFHTVLNDSDLEGLDADTTPIVFVPVSGSKTEFAKYIGAVQHKRENAVSPQNVTIFGYPEWITFRGTSLDEICNLDATIYSRFLATDSNTSTQRLKDRFKELYGAEMFDAVPTQGILGYDVATFAIEGLRDKEANGVFPTELDGVQSRWHLIWSGEDSTDGSSSHGGLINEALYFINYHPGGIVEWTK